MLTSNDPSSSAVRRSQAEPSLPATGFWQILAREEAERSPFLRFSTEGLTAAALS